jgi:type IV pilus assembly protein PilA
MLKNRKAFTLLELIVVIVVAGILAGIAIPSFNSIREKSKEEAAVQEAVAFGKNVTAIGSFDLDGTGAALDTTDAGSVITTALSETPGADAWADATDTFTATNGYDVEMEVVSNVLRVKGDGNPTA